MKEIILTREDVEKIKKQIHELKTKIIPHINKELKQAIEDGDLRENAPFDVAKQKFVEAKNKLHELQQMLKNAKVVNKNSNQDQKIVKLGSKVKINMQGQEKIIEIVSDFEADLLNNKFSINSPIAKQLLGKKEGDSVSLTTPNGSQIVIHILSVNN